MYERTYGYLYDAKRSTTEDAKLIRGTVKTMQKAGVLPADWKISVRTDKFAGGSAIRITATSPRPIYAANPNSYRCSTLNVETGEHVHAYVDKFTVEAKVVRAALEELHQAYNHDGSEMQVDYWDVKFYGTVDLTVAAGVAKCLDGVDETEQYA